jgi:hypothetical protein
MALARPRTLPICCLPALLDWEDMKADVRISNNAKFLHDLALSTCTRAMVQTQISLMTDIQNFPTAISTTSTIYSIKRKKKRKRNHKYTNGSKVASCAGCHTHTGLQPRSSRPESSRSSRRLVESQQSSGSFLFLAPGIPRPSQKIVSWLVMRPLGIQVLVCVWVFMSKPSSGSSSTGEWQKNVSA